MSKPLSEYFSLKRRYSRSINLERDLEKVDALAGYILTERSVDATKRIIGGLTGVSEHRAWTVTSVYGTGKSAFAHFLASLCAPQSSQVRQTALAIAACIFGSVLSMKMYLASLPQERVVAEEAERAVALATDIGLGASVPVGVVVLVTALLPDRKKGALPTLFITSSDSPVSELSSTLQKTIQRS